MGIKPLTDDHFPPEKTMSEPILCHRGHDKRLEGVKKRQCRVCRRAQQRTYWATALPRINRNLREGRKRMAHKVNQMHDLADLLTASGDPNLVRLAERVMSDVPARNRNSN